MERQIRDLIINITIPDFKVRSNADTLREEGYEIAKTLYAEAKLEALAKLMTLMKQHA